MIAQIVVFLETEQHTIQCVYPTSDWSATASFIRGKTACCVTTALSVHVGIKKTFVSLNGNAQIPAEIVGHKTASQSNRYVLMMR
jgi:hypothetical protein